MKYIYTYHVPVAGFADQTPLIRLWAASWWRNGWVPKVLNLTDAARHPRYREVEAKVRSFPTVNPVDYEVACWLRWLAFDLVGGGWTCDYDVINNTFNAAEAPDEELRVHDLTGCPCLVNANAEGAHKIVASILSHGGGNAEDFLHPNAHDGVVVGRRHWSDMYFFKDRVAKDGWLINPETCFTYTQPGWEKAKTVHFSNGACRHSRPGVSREQIVREFTGL